MKKKNTKKAKLLGILSGASFNLKKHNREIRRRLESENK